LVPSSPQNFVSSEYTLLQVGHFFVTGFKAGTSA